MKIVIKILILSLTVFLAIGGVMIYAKTRVEPPTEIKSINQFEADLNSAHSRLQRAEYAREEDSIYAQTFDRISVFEKEGRLAPSLSNRHRSQLLNNYSSMFLKRCFSTFDNSFWWNDKDLAYIKAVSMQLQSATHSDESQILKKTTLDSLELVENIISDYYQAIKISRSKEFRGVESAKYIIHEAMRFENDKHLSNCTDLKKALKRVKGNIGKSHYSYVRAQVESLSGYRNYSEYYYENTLVPQVSATVTVYEDEAIALYGSRENVDLLWNRAKNYYTEASQYYKKQKDRY